MQQIWMQQQELLPRRKGRILVIRQGVWVIDVKKFIMGIFLRSHIVYKLRIEDYCLTYLSFTVDLNLICIHNIIIHLFSSSDYSSLLLADTSPILLDSGLSKAIQCAPPITLLFNTACATASPA